MTRWRVRLMDEHLSRAGFPHNMKTAPFCRRFTVLMTASVKVCQPALAWEFASPRRTVNDELRSKTPCCAHFVRSPLPFGGSVVPGRSRANSTKMFLKEGGNLQSAPSAIEKHNP